tara:strand:- start:111396 stop:114194 length:2799 start_codon:yes stop_codon:yes gene_type:complete
MTVPAPSSRPSSIETDKQNLAPPSAARLLHGVVLRPDQLLWDGRHYTGPTPVKVHADGARHVPGVVAVVIRQSFIGVVASQPGQAQHAKSQIHVQWSRPVTDTPKSLPGAPVTQSARSYQYQTDTQAASWAIALFDEATLKIWCRTTQPESLRHEISALLSLTPEQIQILPNGQYPTESYDAAVDAALLCIHAPSRAVKVAQPAHPATLIRITVDGDKNSLTEKLSQYPARRPSVAALLCGFTHTSPATAVQNNDAYGTPIRLRFENPTTPISTYPSEQVGAAQIFARESFFDETCKAQKLDPVQARLNQLTHDLTGRNLIESVASRAQWNNRPSKAGTGQGFAYGHVIDNEQDPPQQIWSAWIAEVSVDKEGLVDITRLTVGHSTEELNSRQATPEIESSLRQFAQGLLKPPDSFDQWGNDKEKPDFQVARPNIDIVPQQNENAISTHIAWNEKARWPAAAAIANAIHDATGVRLRDTPFDSRQLQQALAQKPTPPAYKKWTYGLLGGIAATAAGLVVSAMPWRSAIAPVAVDTRIYSEEAINRGRLVAIAGDCTVCHTAEDGLENTGGRALETPFGVVYSTNITPDPETGIGSWSYEAFERAMREGIHRDGRHLYPVFPYTAFAKISDTDMQSLYAYLMTQPAVKHTPPKTELAFPYNARPLMAGWNTLFHENARFEPDPTKTTLWNRGAYLVQGAGHCAACHTPRNALGAEKSGEKNYLAGGFADGWEAPPLNGLSKAPIAWTETSLYDYLRTGFSSLHGVASGPMAPVVEGLAQLPETDVRAIAHYLSSLNPGSPESEPAALTAAKLEETSRNNSAVMTMPGESLFEGACAVCHDAREGPPLFGSRPSLALNTNLHSDHPDNVIQVLMHGIADPTQLGLGDMPGFKDSLNNQQIKDLLEYMRARFAPEKAPWQGLDEKIETIRNQTVR